MRIIKQLSVSAAIISLVCGCLFGARPALAHGGQGAGGGNSSGRTIATPEDIQQAVYTSKFALKLALNQMLQRGYAPSYRSDVVVRSILIKPNLFEDLDALKIHQQIAPCKYDGLKRDGDIHGNDVCVSLGQLQNYQYSEDEILRKVTGLLGHEFAHKRGILYSHDSDADIIRDRVEEHVPAIPMYNFLGIFTNSDAMQTLQTVDSMYSTFRTNAKTGLAQTCASAALVLASLTELDNDVTPFGSGESYSFLSPSNQNLLEAAVYRTALVTIFGCGIVPTSNNWVLSDLKDIFDETASPITMYEVNYDLAMASVKNDPKVTPQMRAEIKPAMDQQYCSTDVKDSDCNGLKSTYFSKVAFGDLNAMNNQIFEAHSELSEPEGELFQIVREAHDLNEKYFRNVCTDGDGWMVKCPSEKK